MIKFPGSNLGIIGRILDGLSQADPISRPSETHTVEETREKSKKEQVFEWLEQRQAYVDDAFNGCKQSMADVRAEMEADFPTMKAPEWHDWTWDADGNVVRAPDRSKKP